MNTIHHEILKFVNSKDIRNHLEKTGYEFNALEAAWLVWQSRGSSLEERHRAWKRIIAEYPDCPIPVQTNAGPQPGLHRFLEEYMDMENRALERFRDSTGAVYQVRYYFNNGSDELEMRAYSQFDPENMNLLMADEDDLESICFYRLPLDASDHFALNECADIRMDRNGRIIAIVPDIHELDDHSMGLIVSVFPGLRFDFPTPFQEGDILWDPDQQDGFCGGPFVFTGIHPHGISDRERMKYLYTDASYSGMAAHGLFVSPEHNVYSDCMPNYMNCEYYPKELTGIQRLLKPFSAYKKCRIDAELLLHACRNILLDTGKNDSGLEGYTQEMLKEAGIIK